MAKEFCRYNGAPGGIVPAIFAVRIRNAAGRRPVPREIRAILPERAAQPLGFRRVHPGVRAGVEVMEAQGVGVGHNVIGGKEDGIGIPGEKRHHGFPNKFKRCFRMAKRAFIANGRGKHVEGDLAPRLRKHLQNSFGICDVVPGEGIHKDRPIVPPVVGDLLFQHVLPVPNSGAGLIISPDGNVNFIAHRLGNFSQTIGCNGAQGDLAVANITKIRHKGRFGARQNHIGDTPLFFRFHELPPLLGVPVIVGKLLIPLIVITAVALDVAAMGHVIGGLPQEKIAAHSFPTPVCFRIGQKVFEPISGSLRLIVD